MLRFGRLRTSVRTISSVSAGLIIVGGALTACSADITRFGESGLGFRDDTAQREASSPTNSRPLFSQTGRSAEQSIAPAPVNSTETYQTTRLANVRPAADRGANRAPAYQTVNAGSSDYATSTSRRSYTTQSSQPPVEVSFGRAPQDSPAPVSQAASTSSGERIVVQRGDTLYQIARRHGVSVRQIKQANGLTSNVIRPGQELYLSNSGVAPTRTQSARTPQAQTRESGPASFSGGNTYTVQPGDSLYAISRRTGVRVAELKQLNNIRDVRRMRPGMVLQLRGREDAPSTRFEPRQSRTAALAPKRDSIVEPVKTTTKPIVLNPQPGQRVTTPTSRIDDPRSRQSAPVQARKQKTAKVAPRQSNTSASDKFRWPINGRIIRGFGKRADGSNNDGINIAAPVGTDVHAAEAGVVAYAGNELKGYGNLILIRHDNGFVTAYAHGSRMLVRRGDAVRRGQVIAKVGKTGSVTQPQLHFELREGAKPVDPMPHLGRL